MRVLLVKLSSLGDVVHNLPVVSDLLQARPDAKIEWAIESPYTEIAALHPGVTKVWPVPLRRLKKNWRSSAAWSDFLASRSRLAEQQYDHVLDTQGLLKSAWVARWPEGVRNGYDKASAREPMAARLYDRAFPVARDLHAVTRNRQLAAKAFGYSINTGANYGLEAPTDMLAWLPASPYVVFLHATSRANKMWPDVAWIALGACFHARGIRVVLPWGSAAERAASERLAAAIPDALIAPAMSLTHAATMLARATAVVGVDTGLAHLAVALQRPTVGVYITTQPGLTGLHGNELAVNLGGGTVDAPHIPDVDLVWQTLQPWLPNN
ncbi:MAG: lipopolysaccharide heptosyltransferase I [Betaproteobacteria bacterium]|nr:lipopolysaccharide heptosyltransferase I [Betaproteobacteria bacterium]